MHKIFAWKARILKSNWKEEDIRNARIKRDEIIQNKKGKIGSRRRLAELSCLGLQHIPNGHADRFRPIGVYLLFNESVDAIQIVFREVHGDDFHIMFTLKQAYLNQIG